MKIEPLESSRHQLIPAFAKATDSDGTGWDEFVSRCSGGSFYHLYGWKGIVEHEFGHDTHYLLARSKEDIVGVLPLVFIESRFSGRILCSVPFLNFGGPCAGAHDIAVGLLGQATTVANQLHADYAELRCTEPLPIDLPVSLRKLGMTISLRPDPDEIWNTFTSKHRNNIRRACKQGLAVTSGGIEHLNAFYTVLERSWSDLGTPLYRKSFFEAILRTFPDQIRIHVCLHDGMPVAVALNGHFNGTVEGMWAGGLPSARPLQANYVLYWEMIRDACLRGYSRFHLGRSTADSGSEQFKSRWNAEPQQLYWYYYLPRGGPMPALNVDNPRYRLAIAAWRRLPLWVTRRLGPPLARCIP